MYEHGETEGSASESHRVGVGRDDEANLPLRSGADTSGRTDMKGRTSDKNRTVLSWKP